MQTISNQFTTLYQWQNRNFLMADTSNIFSRRWIILANVKLEKTSNGKKWINRLNLRKFVFKFEILKWLFWNVEHVFSCWQYWNILSRHFQSRIDDLNDLIRHSPGLPLWNKLTNLIKTLRRVFRHRHVRSIRPQNVRQLNSMLLR